MGNKQIRFTKTFNVFKLYYVEVRFYQTCKFIIQEDDINIVFKTIACLIKANFYKIQLINLLGLSKIFVKPFKNLKILKVSVKRI